MKELREDLNELLNKISELKVAIGKLIEYKGNKYYKEKYYSIHKDLNRSYKFFRAKLDKLDEKPEDEKIKKFDSHFSTLLSKKNYEKKLSTIEELEFFCPELEIELEGIKIRSDIFEIPREIPINESRQDLEEAIKNYKGGCYLSTLVMCRRAYEGALVEIYKIKTGEDPIEEVKCKHCNNVVKTKSYIGISKLHKWAIENKIITEKLKQIGFMVPDLGSGGAHPSLTHFPRDREIAKLGITATIPLLKEIYTEERMES